MKKLTYLLFFKAFSNSTRFDLIGLLREKPQSVTSLCKKSGFEQSRVSHSLRCLENCGFVTASRDGKSKIYALDEKHILPILREIDCHIRRYNQRLKTCGVLK